MKALIIIFTILALFSGRAESKELRDVQVYADEKGYILRDPFSGKELGSFEFADDAIKKGIVLLPDGGSMELSSGKFVLRNTVYLKNGISLTGRGRRTELIIQAVDSTGVGIYGQGLKNVIVSDLSLIAADKKDTLVKAGICYDHN